MPDQDWPGGPEAIVDSTQEGWGKETHKVAQAGRKDEGRKEWHDLARKQSRKAL